MQTKKISKNAKKVNQTFHKATRIKMTPANFFDFQFFSFEEIHLIDIGEMKNDVIFNDANLRIRSLSRIREVDEELLNLSEKESGLSSRTLSRQGVHFIQVLPNEEISPESMEAMGISKKCCIEEHSKYNPDHLDCDLSNTDYESVMGKSS